MFRYFLNSTIVVVDYNLSPGASCQSGYLKITNIEECHQAGKSLLPSRLVLPLSLGTTRPRGCFHSKADDYIYFNVDMGENSKPGDSVICKNGKY